ncbi:PREDICTED: uncharacterized protein LOC106554014, partial [Thamnophis sirtalis]|uniref:Uncharacterized protein LOC106554014 n=1 Tax=Thamnophis sirtalis TaxID=35019 RepID=A0A6I9YVQ3_9SAUR
MRDKRDRFLRSEGDLAQHGPPDLKDRNPSDHWMEKDNLSNRGTLKPEQMPLCDEVTFGLADAKPISNCTSKRKRKNSLSGMNTCENSLQRSGEQVEMVSCAEEGPPNRPPKRMQEKDEIACELLGAMATPSGLLPGPILSPKKRKLILHIDLNNTILVSDAITKQDPSAALNCYLSTVTWGKLSHTGEWQWVSESPSLHPPCQGAVSFYSQYGRNTKFTETLWGKKFRDIHRQHLKLLEWQGQPHPQLSIKEQAKHYHLVLPSFFRLLESLHREGREFAVIFRTFGTDLLRVLQAVSCALEGQHPGFPALGGISLPIDLRLGKIRCNKKKVALSHGAEQLSSDNGCRKMYAYFSSREGISGFQDHFEWWAKNNYSSQGGKPIWVDPQDSGVQHICIDDNIRLTDSDTIVHPQVFLEQGSDIPRTIPTSELYDICLVQTDLLEAIAD